MEQKRILVVDDEQDLCDILVFNLTTAGYQAEAVCSAEEAIGKGIGQYDLMLLDVMMPGMSGFDLAKLVREDSDKVHIPIIFLTAKDSEEDTLQGFCLGADDYIKKPFSVREVLARVNAVLRRNATTAQELVYEGLVVDAASKSVIIDGQKVELTRTEYELLRLLMNHRGEVFSRQQLLERVWPADVVVSDRAVDVSVTRLRKKIGPYSQCILARQGFGYYFCL